MYNIDDLSKKGEPNFLQAAVVGEVVKVDGNRLYPHAYLSGGQFKGEVILNKEAKKNKEQLEALRKQLDFYKETLLAELNAYKKINPETAIFYKKKALVQNLLSISVEDLKNAPEQPWYEEYLALLQIRLENPALCFLGNKIVNDLIHWYSQIKNSVREVAVLGIIQFIDPTELQYRGVPFNQHLWHKKMMLDIQSICLNHYTDVTYTNTEIATYYLSRQASWRHEKRKMRVVFIVNSRASCDKFLPVYEAMRQREDIIVSLVIHANADYEYHYESWAYFHSKYPNDMIYDYSLMDLRKLQPDYVFLSNPYENRRLFPSFRANDIVKFAKICMISYGASLAYTFVNRLFDDFPNFWRNVYFIFCSSQTVKTVVTEKFLLDFNMNYKHIEFLGYPVLKNYYEIEMTSAAKKRILWTPRWSVDDKIGGSHFLEYKDKFISLRDKYGEEIDLYFRPHPNLFGYLKKHNYMSEEEVNAYKKTLEEKNILRHTDMSDMDKNIRDIDIFIADYSSILIEFFLTGRPIIYCEYPNAIPLPEYEEMFAAMYIAHSWDEVEKYLDDLLAGKDPLLEKRQEIAKQIYEIHKYAVENIVDTVVMDFNRSLYEAM